MIISFTIFSSIFTYLQSAKNSIERKNNRINLSIIFPLFIISIWEIINLITFDLNISYYVLYIFYLISFITIILFFTGFNIKYWIIKKSQYQQLINKLPILFFLLFIAIFFLFFYHQKNTQEQDMWYYYQFMNEAHTLGNNHFSQNIIHGYSTYLIVGIYELGASLDLYSRLFLFPYLVTFLFLFISSSVAYSVLDKYLPNSIFRKNILYLFITIFIFFFYVFYNFRGFNYYTTIPGDWVSCTYEILLTIEFLINIKTIKNHYYFFVIPLSLLFISESSASLLPLLMFILIIMFFLFRHKCTISPWFFISVLLLTCYSIFTTIIIVSGQFQNQNWLIYSRLLFAVPFIFYLLLVIISIDLFISNTNLVFIRNNKKILKINELWNSKFLNLNYQNYWFKNNKFWTKLIISFFVLAVIIFSFYSFNLIDSYVTAYTLLVSIILLIFLCSSLLIIIYKNKINLIFIFLVFYCTVSLLLLLIFFRTNAVPTFFFKRLCYSSMYIGFDYILIIQNIVITFIFLIQAINWKRTWFNVKSSKNNKFFKKNLLFNSLVGFSSIMTFVPVPIYQAVTVPTTMPALASPNLIFHFGLSENTLTKIHEYNFENKLTFCDFYLPATNNSSLFNLSISLYPPYGQINWFYMDMEKAKFKNLNGEYLKIDDVKITYENEIIPYYSYICIRSKDNLLLEILQSKKLNFSLVDNINNQLFIFKNNNVNKNDQNKFIEMNSQVQIS